MDKRKRPPDDCDLEETEEDRKELMLVDYVEPTFGLRFPDDITPEQLSMRKMVILLF